MTNIIHALADYHTSDEHCDAKIPRSVAASLEDGKMISYTSIASHEQYGLSIILF